MQWILHLILELFNVLQGFLAFIIQNQESVSFLLSFAVAITTSVDAFLTALRVLDTREMKRRQIEPMVSITLQQREEGIALFDMIIQNIGPGTAYNVSFNVQPDLECELGRSLSEIGLFRKGLSYLAPNQKYQFFLTSVFGKYETLRDSPIEIDVSYTDCRKTPYTNSYYIDFALFEGMAQLGTPPLHEISDAIKSIEESLNKICAGGKRMKVIAYTTEDLKQEQEQKAAKIEEMKAKTTSITEDSGQN